jgi:hypothetical protein
LKHGAWLEMIKERMPFSRHVVHRLMVIADHEQITNVEHAPHLPAAWSILYDLTHLTAEQFEIALTAGQIHPKMTRKDVRALRGQPANSKKAKAAPNPADVEKDVAALCSELKGMDAAHTLDREIRKRLFLALGEAMGLNEQDFGMFRLSIGKGAKR